MLTLTFVQQYGPRCWMGTGGRCNQEDCIHTAIGTWQDNEHNIFHLCENHRKELNAPVATPGVEYAPTMALMNGWVMKNGIPINDAKAAQRR